jgi:type IV pilus assembly protein PilY1
MNSQTLKSITIGTALLLTLTVGAPAVADDTELLIVDPASTVSTQPNILFILDTSGSMGDPVSSTQPYDSTQDYSGLPNANCDKDRIYWTTIDVVPACQDALGNANGQYVDKASFLCEDATLRMTGIGAYTGIMVQHHSSGVGPASARWQQFEIGNTSDPVECQNDSGVHGAAVAAAEVYAMAGSGQPQFTSDPLFEISWGSGDAAQAYTAYDGNYLHLKENPVVADIPKMTIMKAVTKNLMNAIEDVNVGLMRFNDSEGGRVIHDISYLDTDRAAILAKIEALIDDGRTPLAESLFESALYWRGMSADYGDFTTGTTTIVDPLDPLATITVPTQTEPDTDASAFVSGVPGTYQQPALPVCTRNFNVLLTDGQPVGDAGAQTKAPADLPGFPASCAGTGDGRCLDEISAYLATNNISGDPNNLQTVVTHTIGFAINLQILEDAAIASGGEYHRADNVDQLTTALMRIVENILDKGLSFSAPTVAVNTFNRTQNLNDLYISTFLPDSKVHWPGNLKKYTLDSAGVIKDASTPPRDAVNPISGFFDNNSRSHWTVGTADGSDVLVGGAANVLPDPANRLVYTNHSFNTALTAASNRIDTGNLALTLADFGLSGAAGEPTLPDIINWTLGEDVLDDDNVPATTVRYDMGDPLHSQPAAVVYGGTAANPDVVVYTATNDGYLHAIDGDTGRELWSFVPKQLLPDLPELMLNGNSTYKHYGIDGDVVPVVKDYNKNGIIDGNDFVHIIFGMRRGGTQYYSIDVTTKTAPVLNWIKTYPEFGQSWSRPVVARVDIDSNLFDATLNPMKAVVILGEGYDTVHDTAALPASADNVGAGISMLELFSGERVWRAGRSNADLTIPAMTRSIPSEVRVVDFSGDGFIDRMYAVDVGGQVFRFDVFPNNPLPAAAVTGGVIARFGGEGVASAGDTDTRRFYSAPDVSIFTDPVLNRRFIAIGVGSGYRAHPLDTSATDMYFSLRDPDLFAKLDTNAYLNYNIAYEGDMHPVSGQVRTSIGANERGWKFEVPAGQMVLSSSATFDNSVFFISYAPNVNAASSCQVAPGHNFLYRVDVSNGDPIANNLDTMVAGDSNAARVTALEQGGIAPTPAFLFPSGASGCVGAACAPPPIGCVGVECFDPSFRNNLVKTLWTQDGIE